MEVSEYLFYKQPRTWEKTGHFERKCTHDDWYDTDEEVCTIEFCSEIYAYYPGYDVPWFKKKYYVDLCLGPSVEKLFDFLKNIKEYYTEESVKRALSNCPTICDVLFEKYNLEFVGEFLREWLNDDYTEKLEKATACSAALTANSIFREIPNFKIDKSILEKKPNTWVEDLSPTARYFIGIAGLIAIKCVASYAIGSAVSSLSNLNISGGDNANFDFDFDFDNNSDLDYDSSLLGQNSNSISFGAHPGDAVTAFSVDYGDFWDDDEYSVYDKFSLKTDDRGNPISVISGRDEFTLEGTSGRNYNQGYNYKAWIRGSYKYFRIK